MLVADDSKLIRTALSDILSGAGHSTVLAGDGIEAMEAIDQNPDIGLIFLDWHMPRQDGFEFLVALRAREEYATSPLIVMVTTENTMDSIQKALGAGANEYVMKPFDQDIILGKLNMMGIGNE